MKGQFFFLAILFLCIGAVSCKKNNDSPPPPSKTPEEILAGHTWQANEMRAIVNNTPYYYKRGSSSNSSNYNLDNENIQFKADKTGTYIGSTGGTFPITWNFTNEEKTKLSWTAQLSGSTNTTVNWDIVELTDSKLRYNEYYLLNGNNAQTFGERIPK